MAELSRQRDFLETLDELPEEAQNRVVDLVRCLSFRRPGVPGYRLTSLHGILDPAQGREMIQAIDEACETVDPDGW